MSTPHTPHTPHTPPTAPNPHSPKGVGAGEFPIAPNPTKWGPLAPHLLCLSQELQSKFRILEKSLALGESNSRESEWCNVTKQREHLLYSARTASECIANRDPSCLSGIEQTLSS
ncbi:MAG: hypothetical protein C4323_14355 [Mastigocladus sp. ERB_26_2]